MNEKERARAIDDWSYGLDDLIEALRNFRESLGWIRDDNTFMRLYGAIIKAGGDLDNFSVNGVGVDRLRELLTSV